MKQFMFHKVYLVKGDVIMAEKAAKTTSAKTASKTKTKKTTKAAEAKVLEKAEETIKAAEQQVEAGKAEAVSAQPAEAVKSQETAEKKPVKKTTKKAKTEKAPVEKEAAVKKEPVKEKISETAEAEEAVLNVQIQFPDSTYNNEKLMNIVKDVWKYDLEREEKDIKTVDLYVKPYERIVYYVINGTEAGSFQI